MERLDKILANTGRWSRKEARELVRAGRVAVDGVTAQAADGKYDPAARFEVDGETVSGERLVYLMLHKPAGLLSATEDPRQPTVLELLPQHLRRVGLFPAGRLDKDTEGLLLLTNDGPLAHRLLAPRHHVDKTYFVRVDGELDGADAAAFAAGMMLEDGLACLPAGLEVLEQPDTALVTLHEGKYHQIKRMLAARGKPVVYLKRLRRWPLCGRRRGGPSGERSRPTCPAQPGMPALCLALRFRLRPAFVSQPTASVLPVSFRQFQQKILQNLLKRAKRPGIIERKWTRERFVPLRGNQNKEAITMSSRIFQSVVLQMKDSTERAIGVIDSEGTVVACNELSCIGEHWPGAVEAVNRGEGDAVRFDGRTFKALAGWGAQFDYAAFVKGEDSEAQMLCAMATVALNGAKTYYEEKHDKATFVKNIISDNILLGDIYVRAKELHFVSEAPRAVFLIRQVETSDPALIDVVHTLFPDKQVDFVLSISETDVALIKQLSEGAEPRELYKIAKQIEEKITEELHVRVVIGIGTIVGHIRELARAYKEAGIAIDVGRVFDTEKSIINYENLGIGRLIYQLPTTLCEMFLQEVFKKNPIDALDQETLFTINKFFENNLNVSETARKLFVHRNTLVYRLEKIKKLTGLDLREFDDAITFKVALMVKKYLISRGIDN